MRRHRRIGVPASWPQYARYARHCGLSLGFAHVTDAPSEILFQRRGSAGIDTLNRPHAHNAVTLRMVRALTRQLEAWQSDPSVTRVVVSAAGGKAFSAGGDIRALYDLGRAGHRMEMLPFWREEYTLNAMIKTYP